MGNWKKKKGNIGRNKQRRFNRRTGKVENFNQRNRSHEKTSSKVNEETNEHLSPEEARQEARKNHAAKGFVPEVKPRTFRHCTCEGTELALKNQRLLDLLRQEPRGYDDATGAHTVLVISPRFRRRHAHHMRHFVAFLGERNIRYR
jgi:hypothetical protein